MSAPTVVVALDDGTGTYPTDITSALESELNISSYGRSDESPVAESASLSFTLDNSSGSFSSGSGFGGGGFGGGGFGGGTYLYPGQGVRVTVTAGATTKDRFTGRISSAEVSWPGGGQSFSVVNVSAVDGFAELSRRILRSMLEQEILADSPVAYYTLAEAEGSTAAGDTSGNTAAPLTLAGSGAAMAFGNGIGPVDGLTAATFAGDTGGGGQYVRGGGSALISSGSWTVEAFVAVNSVPNNSTNTILELSADTGFSNVSPLIDLVYSGTTGLAAASIISTGAVAVIGTVNITDGATHHVAATFNGTTLTLYVDGASTGTPTAASALPSPVTQVVVGNGLTGTTVPNATISHVAVYTTALSAGRIASHAAALTSFAEDTAARATRLASYVGRTCTTTSGSGQQVAFQNTSGASAFDALQAVATVEDGVLFLDGSGDLQLQGRGYRAEKTTADLALGEEEPAPDTTVPYDTLSVYNTATVTSATGATQTYLNATSVSDIGEFPVSLDLIAADDQTALNRAQWLVNKHLNPAPRLPSLTLDPLAPASATSAQLLALKIGDRISLTMPSQQWAGSGDMVIEGWSEIISVSEWSITYNLLPWALFQSGIYDDAGSLYDSALYG